MNIDAIQVINKYKALLAEQQYQTIVLEVQVQQLTDENARLLAELSSTDNQE